MGTMTLAGAMRAQQFLTQIDGARADFWSTAIPMGFWAYTLPLTAIILAHELGHIAACRRHNLDHSWPVFVPAPFPMTGTFGAFLLIKTPPQTRRALFDVGFWGPVAGFAVTVGVLLIGLDASHAVAGKTRAFTTYRMPLVMQWISAHYIDGASIIAHPTAWAGWVGLMITSLNLLPCGQLDGGQIVSALWPKQAWRISIATVAVVITASYLGSSWLSFGIMMLLMLPFCEWRTPALSSEPLPVRYWAFALVAFATLALSITPL